MKLERLYHFASLQLAEDSANNEHLARIGQIQNLMTKIAEAGAFVVPEIQAIDDETFAKFIVAPALADWRVLDEARVALLDAPVTLLIGRWPELASTVAGRLLRRSR